MSLHCLHGLALRVLRFPEALEGLSVLQGWPSAGTTHRACHTGSVGEMKGVSDCIQQGT